MFELQKEKTVKKKETQDALAKKWAKVITKAWTDESFKQKLLKNPALTLQENGIAVPKETKIEVHTDTSKIVHLVIPQKPDEELSDAELKKVAAGLSAGAPGADAATWFQTGFKA